jgi:hypothetical protein
MPPYAIQPLTDSLPVRSTTQVSRGCRLVNDDGEGAHRRERSRMRRKGCDHHHALSDAGYDNSPERLDRTYAEILQEVRVAQTGVQVIFAFVLTLAFTPRFKELTGVQLRLYIVTLVLGALAASLLMAPAAFNRLVFRHGLRARMVSAANRFALFGLAFLLATMGCAIMLILKVVLNSSTLAAGLTSAIVTWFVLIWFAIPTWWRYRHRECGSD